MILYTSYLEKFEKLSDEQFGQLMRAGLNYVASEEVPDFDDFMLGLAFDVLKVEVDQNIKKYEAICEKKREAGRKGGLAKANKNKQEEEELADVADASFAKQELADVADANFAKQDLADASSAKQNVAELSKPSFNDNDNKNDNDNDVCINNTNLEREGKKSSDFTPPTHEEVISYCYTHNLRIDTRTFFDYYESQGWCKSKGQKVKDWKALVRAWASREADYPRAKKSTVEKVLDFQAAQANQGRGT